MNNNWLYQQLQKWTPFSVLALIGSTACLVIIVLFPILHLDIPSYVYVVLSVLGVGTGTVQAVNHGVILANGVAKSTASETVKSVSQNLTITNKD